MGCRQLWREGRLLGGIQEGQAQFGALAVFFISRESTKRRYCVLSEMLLCHFENREYRKAA